jgi:RAB protein geranylgeranyltransferase component A
MTELKHTPAPWHVGGGLNIENEFGYRIAFVSNCEQSLFNAKLIAAAPDLLEALVKTVEDLSEIVKASDGVEAEGIDLYEVCDSLKKYRAVIARATT